MQKYARSIEEVSITCTPQPSNAIAQTSYFRLAQLQGTSPLFPNIFRLSIDVTPSSSNFYTHIPIFLSPKLTSLTLGRLGQGGQASATSFLLMLGPQRTLSHLSLDGFSLSPAVLKAITGCGELNKIELTNVGGTPTQPTLHTLFSMPSLINITFHTKNQVYSTSESVETLLPGSARLTSLRLTGPFKMLAEWTKYFSSSGCDLQTLSLEITKRIVERPGVRKGGKCSRQYETTSPAEIDTLIREAVTAWRQSLSNFQVESDHPIHGALLPTFLDAFSGFNNLEILKVTDITLGDMNAALLRNMCYWPSLTCLHLPRVNFGEIDCTISMETLRHLAENCPRLTFLRVLMHNPKEDSFSAIASTGVRFPYVHTLSVGTWPESVPGGTAELSPPPSDISDKASQEPKSSVKQFCSIARDLLRVFPRLRTLETHQSLSEGIWGDVKALVDLCRESEECSKALSN